MYQQILNKNPDQIDALHLLGVIAKQEERPEKAVNLITRALQLKPDFAEAHNNLGEALRALGRNKEALASYQKSVALKPEYVNGHLNLGVALQEYGELDAAIASYRNALRLKPGFDLAYYNLGNALRDLGKPGEAVEYYRKAIKNNNKLFLAHNNLGLSLQELGNLEEAIVFQRQTVELAPEFSEGYYNLHALLLDTTNMMPSIGCLERAVEIQPTNVKYRFTLGMLWDYSGDTQRAETHFSFIENGPNADKYWLDAWHYLKANEAKIPPIVGTSIETFKLALEASISGGLVLEFGVRFGTSIRQITTLVEEEIHGFDSFEGLPDPWAGAPKGAYSTKGAKPVVPKNVILHDGWFEETLPLFIQKHREPVRFMNIDCDLYSSTKTILSLFAEQIVPGTVIVFDEYIGNSHWREDEFKAFQEAVLKFGWTYDYLCFSFMTNQVAVRIN